jgi:hypothetical protein
MQYVLICVSYLILVSGIHLTSNAALDAYQRIRLINYIRKEVSISDLLIGRLQPYSRRSAQKPAPSTLNINGSEAFLNSDEYIKPVIEDDPLLRKLRVLMPYIHPFIHSSSF